MINEIFSNQIASQTGLLLYPIIFLGGIITSLSPCTLGMLPIIVGYVGGQSETKNWKNVFQVIFFVVGLSLTLTTLGIASAFAGKALGAYSQPIWTVTMASLIMVMGLSLLGILEIPMPILVKKMPQNKNNNLVIYPILLGIAFAFASTPCSTPMLAGIMAYASLKANIIGGAIMLLLYSLGQSLVLVLAALFTFVFKKLLALRAFSTYYTRFSGIILIFASIYIFINIFGKLI